jgi:FdrA protein
VVLGHGAHPDPARELGPAIAAACRRAADDGRDLAIVVSLVGTRDDPQRRDAQAAVLHDAGATVTTSNADAALLAASLALGRSA